MFGSKKRKEQKAVQWQELHERAVRQALTVRAGIEESRSATGSAREELDVLYARREGAPRMLLEQTVAEADRISAEFEELVAGFDATHAEYGAEEEDEVEVLEALVDYYVNITEAMSEVTEVFSTVAGVYGDAVKQAHLFMEKAAPVRARVHEALAAAEPEVTAKGGHAARARLTGIAERLDALDTGAVLPSEDRPLSGRYRELEVELAELRDSL